MNVSPAGYMRVRRADALTESILERADVFTPRPNWRTRRACAGIPTARFFDTGRQVSPVCVDCPVRIDCTADTVQTEDRLHVRTSDITGYFGVPAELRRTRRTNLRKRATA